MSREWSSVFAVGLDKAAAEISRQRLRPSKPGEVVVLAAFTAIVIIGGLFVAYKDADTANRILVVGLLMVVATLGMGFLLWRTLSREFPFPDDAFHLSAEGLTLFVAGAVHPVRLPWASVRSLDIRLRRVRWTLTVTLADDPGPATGLDQPVVQRALLHRNRLVRGLWYDVDALTEPFPRVEAAVRHYSGGRVAVGNTYRRFVPEHH